MDSKISKILICLDLTEMDRVLLRYAGHFCRMLGTVEQAWLVHNIKFDYPGEAKFLLDELERPLPELIAEEIAEQAQRHFESATHSVDWKVETTNRSSTAHALAGLAHEKETGLVICGRKISYQGSGRVAEKMLRLPEFHGNLLTVPETAPYRMERLLVPVDFSAPSTRALKLAYKMASASDAAAVSCQHVYSIPTHYFPYIPVKGFRRSIEEQAKNDFKKYREALPEALKPISCAFTYCNGRTVAQTVYDFAIDSNKDLIVIGSRGRGGLPAALLGSTAIQLMQFDFHVPLLVVR